MSKSLKSEKVPHRIMKNALPNRVSSILLSVMLRFSLDIAHTGDISAPHGEAMKLRRSVLVGLLVPASYLLAGFVLVAVSLPQTNAS
jgi:hypothetical protein